MEIERKFLIKDMPCLDEYPRRRFMQGYLCTQPTVRVRGEYALSGKDKDEFFLTYKSRTADNGIAREEYNLPLTEEAFEKLIKKCDGNIISKVRHFIPLGTNKEGSHLTAELDVFEEPFKGLIFAEVEFPTMEEAFSFEKPEWFGEDVTDDRRYYNSYLSECDAAKFSLDKHFLL